MTRNAKCLRFGLAVTCLATCGSQLATTWSRADTPLHSADYVWHMSDTSNGTGPAGGLIAEGDVTVGVALNDGDRTASVARGGDGCAARFDGGFLAIAESLEPKMNSESWTIAIRLRMRDGNWQVPILGSYGSDQQVSFALRGRDARDMPEVDYNLVGGPVPTVESWWVHPNGPRTVPNNSQVIEAVWGAREPDGPRLRSIEQSHPARIRPNPLFHDVTNAVMRVNFPVGLIGPRDWHDIVVSLTGPKLMLWIDGVLVDEEYPIGVTRPATVPFLIGAEQRGADVATGFRGLIDHVAIWNRPLSGEEIRTISGGATESRQRELKILGDESPTMQYFRARGHNRKAGDLIPYWDAQSDTFRLFYLILRRNMHSKWDGGHGGLEIWQASTKDLKSWTHHPCTLPITNQWEAWNGTGAVAFHNGKYNWFYPTPHYEGQHQGIQRAVSSDAVHFTKVEPHPALEGGDCEIFQTEDRVFHLVKTGPDQRTNTVPLTDKTLVAWVQLADLDQAGGSILTIEHPDGAQFDALVFGERIARRWMPGSNNFLRTPPDQASWPEETADPSQVVQMALVCHGHAGRLYRNGQLYASYEIAQPLTFPSGSSLIIGKRHTAAGPPNRAYFRGRVLDARLYAEALTAQQIASLSMDSVDPIRPLAWYNFEHDSPEDKTGRFPVGMLYGHARVENETLVLAEGDYLKAPGVIHTQKHLTSRNLEDWTELEEPFISSDKRLATCPNVFKFGEWYYYLCSSGVWQAETATGPWKEHQPILLDNLAVPKTGAFQDNRRIYAGFLPDSGWGGNSVLRELVQRTNGQLGTRFVPELIPACGDRLPTEECVRLESDDQPQTYEFTQIPHDFRLRLEVEPSSDVGEIGIDLRAGDSDDGCQLLILPRQRSVRFTKMTDSSGPVRSGPGIAEVDELKGPFAIDLIARHDIVDAEVAQFRSVTTRYWNPSGSFLRLSVRRGEVTFRDIRIQPLTDPYHPYPATCSNSD